MLSFDILEQWGMELEDMNMARNDCKFVYSESFIEALGYCHRYMHLLFRHTDGWFYWVMGTWIFS